MAGICLLLLNDHVLKRVAPSALTGKLSDFAGLFFFPILLTVIISLPLDRLRIRPRCTASLAFAVTALWFILVKVTVWGNALTAVVVSHLVGSPVTISRDPTDLLALLSLIPAWAVWLAVEGATLRRAPGKAAYLALAAASLACLATPPCAPQTRVVRLIPGDPVIYGALAYSEGTTQQSFVTSSDAVLWNSINEDSIPPLVLAILRQPAQLPVQVCTPEALLVCYRISGIEQVEGSTDGGVTWHPAWQLPAGRRQFMERMLTTQLLGCKRTIDLGPYDLAVLTRNGHSTVVVAAGNEGVILIGPTGGWQRTGVMNAIPTPYTSQSLIPIIFWEILATVILAVIAWIALAFWGTRLLLGGTVLPNGRPLGWVTAPLGWSLLGIPLGIVLAGIIFLELPYVGIIFAAACIPAFFVCLALTWRRAVSSSPTPKAARSGAFAAMIAPLGIFPLSALPFAAWVVGWLYFYVIALALAIAICFLSVAGGVYILRKKLP